MRLLTCINSTNTKEELKASVPKGFGGGSNSNPGDWEEIYSKWKRSLKINNKILKGSIEPPKKKNNNERNGIFPHKGLKKLLFYFGGYWHTEPNLYSPKMGPMVSKCP